jgi:3-oxoacyl-[acyl-carrier protein] reductase
MAEWFDFSGKIALVTGSSRGIGATIVSRLDHFGARCVVNYLADPEGRNKADAERVCASLKDSRMVACDVGNHEEVAQMMGFVRQEFGGLDILVNNAGILRDRTIKKMLPSDWEAVIRVNLTGAFHCIHQAAELLRPRGRIVNIASVSGQTGFFGQANYAASKAGIMALTKTAAREFAKHEVTVNAIAPGFIDTEMSRSMPPEVAKQFASQIPAGHFGKPEDIANVVVFLCSSQASYITGEIVHVNGGFYM